MDAKPKSDSLKCTFLCLLTKRKAERLLSDNNKLLKIGSLQEKNLLVLLLLHLLVLLIIIPLPQRILILKCYFNTQETFTH